MSVIDTLKIMAKVKTHPLVKLAKVVDVGERVRLEVDPGEMYPRTIEDIRHSLATDTDYPLLMIKAMVKELPVEAWDLALVGEKSELRARALEVARLWFTEKLHQTISHHSMTLHILKDDRWRL